jgi:hypothetical protein
MFLDIVKEQELATRDTYVSELTVSKMISHMEV